jgi:glucose-1-phosphate thymidylyltransferase
MQGIILAAGKGKRLQPFSLTRSKAMMPILGRPIVERVMEDFAANGVKNFVLIIGRDDRGIKHYFENETAMDINVRFVHQPERKGMAHALRYAAPFIEDDFILSACDNLVTAEDHLKKMLVLWREQPSPDALLTMMPIPKERLRQASAVSLDGDRVTGIVEKPDPETAPSNIASLPLYIFSRRLLDYLPRVQPSPRGEYELQDAIQMLIVDGGRVRGLKVESRLSLTGPADLLAINRYYLMRYGKSTHLAPKEIGANTQFTDPVYIEAETVIGAGCAIGPNVYIEEGCSIGNGVKVRDAVILRNSRVPEGMTIENDVFMS